MVICKNLMQEVKLNGLTVTVQLKNLLLWIIYFPSTATEKKETGKKDWNAHLRLTDSSLRPH